MALEQAPTFFISDLHLRQGRPQITRTLEFFLSHIAKGARAIYILGDFVDAWVGDDDNSLYVQQLKSLLSRTVAVGTSVYFLHGNRDFLIGERFARETGITLLDEDTVINLYGEPVLLLHGDTLCTHDHHYLAYRRKVRSLKWQRNVLRYPLLLRRTLAAYIRFRSRKANDRKAPTIMDVAETAVVAAFHKAKVRKMIHGHTHRPQRHPVLLDQQQAERIVLGDWEAKGWYVRADTGGQTLVHFPLAQ